jgi:hypothetical protein
MRILFLPFLLAVLFSCGNSAKVPKGILPPAKMEQVMWDALKAEELQNYYDEHNPAIQSLEKHAELYQTVFTLHKTNKEQFKKSLHYYQEHPALLKVVLDSLQRKADRPVGIKKAQ